MMVLILSMRLRAHPCRHRTPLHDVLQVRVLGSGPRSHPSSASGAAGEGTEPSSAKSSEGLITWRSP